LLYCIGRGVPSTKFGAKNWFSDVTFVRTLDLTETIDSGATVGAFDYITALLSFVYALALTHLLTSVTELVRARERVRFSWVHTLWMFNAIFLLLINWLEQYANRAIPHWDFFNATMTFVLAIVQYFTCSFVSPPVPEQGVVDLEAFHDREKRNYLAAFAGLGVMALFSNWYEWQLTHPVSFETFLFQQLSIVPALAVVGVAMIVKQRSLEIAGAIAFFSLLLYFGVAFTGELR
jgi:hypothetical protein